MLCFNGGIAACSLMRVLQDRKKKTECRRGRDSSQSSLPEWSGTYHVALRDCREWEGRQAVHAGQYVGNICREVCSVAGGICRRSLLLALVSHWEGGKVIHIVVNQGRKF